MANPILIVHKNATKITGLIKDGLERTVDISAFLKHPDTTKVVVIEEIVEEIPPFIPFARWGAHAVGEVHLGGQFNWNGTLPNRGAQTVVPLIAGTTTIAYALYEGIHLKVSAEFGGPLVKTLPVRTPLGNTASLWATADVTSLVGADAGNVEGLICHFQTGPGIGLGIQIGLRRFGSSDSLTQIAATLSSMWGTVKLDSNDQFQHLTSRDTSKNARANSTIRPVGYWLTGAGLVATADRDPVETIIRDGAFYDFAVNEQAAAETHAIIQLRGSTQSLGHRVRSKGSINPKMGDFTSSRTAYCANLDSAENLEYATDDPATDFRVEATQFLPPIDGVRRNKGATRRNRGATTRL